MASEFLLVARQVIELERRALSAREIVNIAIREGLFSDKRAGKTPHQTMKAKLSVSIRREGRDSPFVRTAPGRFHLRHLLDDQSQVYEAPPLRPPLPSEEVLLFPTAWLDKHGRFQGIKTGGADRLLRRLFESHQLTYVDRREAEQRDDCKQIITYILVTSPGRILSFRRGNYNRVEDFLRGARCIGFGGHVSAVDRTLFGQSTYGVVEAAARELREELDLPDTDRRRLERAEGISVVGVLNDDATATGRRHFAVILRYTVANAAEWAAPRRNEQSITELRWLDPEASPHELFEFEYWSQLCLLQFYGTARITQPTYIIRRRSPLRPPHILLILGELGSGKSVTTQVLCRDYSYLMVNSGRVLAELLHIPPLESEEARADFQDRAWRFIGSEAGPQLLSKALWKHVEASERGRVLIEGIRQRATLDAFLDQAEGRRVGTMFIHTPFQVAYDFYRTRAGGGRTIYDFIAARSKPVEGEVASLVERADVVLYNWKGARQYRSTIHRLMTDLAVTP